MMLDQHQYWYSYSRTKQKIKDGNFSFDLRFEAKYDIVDYDKNYVGLQLIFDNNKAMRFDHIPYHIFPVVVENKMFAVSLSACNIMVGMPSQGIPVPDVSAIQLGSVILPIAVDPKSVIRPKEEYENELFDLLWRLISGEAGETVDQMLEYTKAIYKSKLDNSDKELNSYSYKSEYY